MTSSSDDFIRVVLADMNGVARGKVLPYHAFKDIQHSGLSIIKSGLLLGADSAIADDMPTIKEHDKIGFPNSYLIPDMASKCQLPWAGGGKYTVSAVHGELYYKEGDILIRQDECPRAVAKTQLQRLDELGMSFLAACELEFIVCSRGTNKPIFDGVDALSHTIFSQHETMWFDVERMMCQAGIAIEAMHAEYCPGQMEFSFKPAPGLQSADGLFNFRNGLRDILSDRGYLVNFVSKPDVKHSGNGAHYNFSVWNKDTGTNAFLDDSAQNGLSAFGRHWIAGMAVHMPALCALQCPTVNCYRRLHQPWAPSKADWGLDDRRATLRVRTISKSGPFMENRLPSSLCNPYLMLAGTIAAGMDGVTRKLAMPSTMDKDASRLPDTLDQALTVLEQDTSLTQALGNEFVKQFIELKRFNDLVALKDSNVKAKGDSNIAAECRYYGKVI